MLSESNPRMSWPRPAPSATRREVSCEREEARPIRNAATFEQAMKNTKPAAKPSRVPTRDLPSATSGVVPVYGSTRISPKPLRSVWILLIEESSRRRPRTQKFQLLRSVCCRASSSNGIQRSTARSPYTPSSQSGATPPTRRLTLPMRICSPLMSALALNSLCQMRWTDDDAFVQRKVEETGETGRHSGYGQDSRLAGDRDCARQYTRRANPFERVEMTLEGQIVLI